MWIHILRILCYFSVIFLLTWIRFNPNVAMYVCVALGEIMDILHASQYSIIAVNVKRDDNNGIDA